MSNDEFFQHLGVWHVQAGKLNESEQDAGVNLLCPCLHIELCIVSEQLNVKLGGQTLNVVGVLFAQDRVDQVVQVLQRLWHYLMRRVMQKFEEGDHNRAKF